MWGAVNRSRRRHDLSMPIVPTAAGPFHFQEAGSGDDPVVLLHAFPLHSGMWDGQLSALTPRFRVIAPDYFGFGKSGGAPPALTMDLLAGATLELLRHLGIDRAAVVGLSMGGYVAFELYRQAPGLFRGLVLCDTKATLDTAESRANREAYARNALAGGPGWVGEQLSGLLRHRPDRDVLAAVKAIAAQNTIEGVASGQRGMALRSDSVPTLGQITCPTLVLFGDEDQTTPFAEAELILQGVKRSRLVKIPGAGHLSNMENPKAFNAALATFCESLPA